MGKNHPSIPDIGKILLEAFSERPIAYYPIYAKFCNSVTAGILLSQLMYWNKKMDGKEFYKTDEELKTELYLGQYELAGAKEKLKALKIISVTRKGVPAKTYYNINTDILIGNITSYLETTELVMGKPDNLLSGNQRTIYTENTQENTDIDFSPAGKVDRTEEVFSDFDSTVQSNLETNLSGISTPHTPQESNETDLKKNQKKVLDEMLYAKDIPFQKSKKLIGDDNLKVFDVLKTELCPFVKISNPSVMEGIPRALSFFKEEFGTEAVSKLIEALKAFKKTQKYVYMKQLDPLLISASTIFKKKFIEETLYSLSFNQQQDGGIHNTQMSEDELRKVEESDAEDRRRIRARRSQPREDSESRV